jgi:hypothetical protein
MNSIAEWTKERTEEEQARRKLESKLRVSVLTYFVSDEKLGWRGALRIM